MSGLPPTPSRAKLSQTIGLLQWIAGNPPDVLATNLRKPVPLFEKFPRRDVFVAPKQGPDPNH